MALGINYSDPRYQKAILAAGAKTEANTQALVSDIQSRFVGNQMTNLMSFRANAQRKDRLNRRLALEQTIFDRDMRLDKNKLSDEKRALNFTTIFGAAKGIYSALEGRSRRLASEAQTAENRAWRERVESRQAAHDKRIEEILRSNL